MGVYSSFKLLQSLKITILVTKVECWFILSNNNGLIAVLTIWVRLWSKIGTLNINIAWIKYNLKSFPEHTRDLLADSTGRALSSIFTKMIKNGGFPSLYFVLFIKHVCAPLLTMEGKFMDLKNSIQQNRYTWGLLDPF